MIEQALDHRGDKTGKVGKVQAFQGAKSSAPDRRFQRIGTMLGICLLGFSLIESKADETVEAAVKHFLKAPNYSWTTAVELKGGPASGVTEIEGKYDSENGWFLESRVENEAVQAAGRGHQKVARVGSSWLELEELSGKEDSDLRTRELLTLVKPHEELEWLREVTQLLSPSAEGNYTATLTPEMARTILLSVVRGRGPVNAEKALKSAVGEFRVWFKEGRLIQYEIYLQASFVMGLLKRSVERTATTNLSEVGETSVELPVEATTALKSRIEL